MVDILYVATSQHETQSPVRSREPTAPARPLPPDRRPGKGHFARAVGAFVPKVTAAAFERYGFHSAEIMTSWETILGADLARMTRPEAIKWPRGSKARTNEADDGTPAAGATLIVACDPAFALEISYRTQDILDRINRYFGYRAIANLRIVQVPRTTEPAGATVPPSRAPRPVRASTETRDLVAVLDDLGHSIASATSAR
jgi:hypothetical protein